MGTVEGQLLKAWRDHFELSQDAVCGRLDETEKMDGSLLGVYERGKSRPTMKTLIKLVKAIGVPGDSDRERLARFFAGPDSAPPVTPEKLDRLIKTVRALRDGIDELAPER